MGGEICFVENNKRKKRTNENRQTRLNKSTIIWIDPNVRNKENLSYINELTSIESIEPKTFTNIQESINYIKSIKFEEIKIIISSRYYSPFVKSFKENIIDIYFAPKIIVFTSDKKKFFENNMGYNKYIETFYKYGGIVTSFQDVKKFLKNETRNFLDDEILEKEFYRDNEVQLTFEYIDRKDKLMLPLFFKAVISNLKEDNLENYTKSLYNTYSLNNKEIEKLLGAIISMKEIPIEILSKYYIRLYTIDSDFYKNLNKDLGLNKVNNYLTFIKVLYEGLKLRSFPLASKKVLYRGSKISNNELNKIKNYLNSKIPDLPGSIVFSRSFLSFSKEKKLAEKFLKTPNNNKDLSKVLYVLENDNNIGYNSSTHGDIEKISFYPNEKEVLFFPFSSFEIKSINKFYKNNELIYEIRLIYLGKYLKEIEDDPTLTLMPLPLPESEFRTQLLNNGLVQKEKIINLNTQTLYKDFKKYENQSYEYIKDKNYLEEDSLALDNNLPENKEYYGEQSKIEYEEENYIANNKMDIALNALEGSIVAEENIEEKAEEIIQEMMYDIKMKNDVPYLGVQLGDNFENSKNKIIVGNGVNDSLDEMLKKLNNK